MHVLGIDAGGSKTFCLLADEKGAVLGEGRGPGANLHTAGEMVVGQVLRDVVHQAIDGSGIEPDAVCVGMAGADREAEWRTIDALLRRMYPRLRILVVNDALIALVAGARDAAGIVIIAGTGSIAYGRNGRGQAARAGGWGHMIGDEGSGYWIGREALSAVMRARDGRGPSTRLTDAILAELGIDDISMLPRIVYDRESPRTSVGGLGPLVQRVANDGDAVARAILERAADELVLGAHSVATQLAMRGDAFTFFLAGGTFRVVPRLVGEASRRLVEVAPRSQVEVLQEAPAMGAVWLALKRATVPVYLAR